MENNENKSRLNEYQSAKEKLDEKDRESVKAWIEFLQSIDLSSLIIRVNALEERKKEFQAKIAPAAKLPLTPLDSILAEQDREWSKFQYKLPKELTAGALGALDKLTKMRIAVVLINDLSNPNHLKQKYFNKPGELLGNIKSAISELKIISY